MKILILNDQPGLAALLSAGLKLDGESMLGVTSPQKALEVVHDYEVLVVNCHLPGMTGLDLIRQAYAQGWRGNVLLTSKPSNSTGEEWEHPLLRMILSQPSSTQARSKTPACVDVFPEN